METKGPFTSSRGERSSVYAVETWRDSEGKIGRPFGPHVVYRGLASGISVRDEYYDDQEQLHREDGPAVVERDDYTGEVLFVHFYKHGRHIKTFDNWEYGYHSVARVFREFDPDGPA